MMASDMIEALGRDAAVARLAYPVPLLGHLITQARSDQTLDPAAQTHQNLTSSC